MLTLLALSVFRTLEDGALTEFIKSERLQILTGPRASTSPRNPLAGVFFACYGSKVTTVFAITWKCVNAAAVL